LDSNIFAAGYEHSSKESTILIWDITKTVNPNYNKLSAVGVEASFTIPGESTVAKLEPKFRPDLIVEPKHAFSKINEDIYSLCWLSDSRFELLYGTE
jgi:hypothetical protein